MASFSGSGQIKDPSALQHRCRSWDSFYRARSSLQRQIKSLAKRATELFLCKRRTVEISEQTLACRPCSVSVVNCSSRKSHIDRWLDRIKAGIELLSDMISKLKDANKVKVLEDMKTEFEDIVKKASESSGPINDKKIYESASSNVKGEKEWAFIKCVVKDKEVKEMFGYKESDKVKAYPHNKCKDALVQLLLKLRFLKSHDQLPTNNQLPLYFCKQVIAEAYKQISVDYKSLPPGTGHGIKRHTFDDPKREKRCPKSKKPRMAPENLEVPHDLARMNKKELLQHSIHLTKELQLIISNFNIPLESLSSYVKPYMEKLMTRAPMEPSGGCQDHQLAFDSNDMNSTVAAEASHHCLPRDVEQVENHVLVQDHLTPTQSCGGCLDTQFAFGSEGINSTVKAEEASRHCLPKDLKQEDFTFGSPIETELWESFLAQWVSESPEIGLEEIFPASAVTTDSPGTGRYEELSAINDDEPFNSSNAFSLTYSIDGIIIETPPDYMNVKAWYGPNAMLIDSRGRPVPMNEEGSTCPGALQQGFTYYPILADPSGPVASCVSLDA